MLTHGLLDLPKAPVGSLPRMGEFPQRSEDLEFPLKGLESGSKEGSCEKLRKDEARALEEKGNLISSSFVHWHGEEENQKERFVINFSSQSNFWGP